MARPSVAHLFFFHVWSCCCCCCCGPVMGQFRNVTRERPSFPPTFTCSRVGVIFIFFLCSVATTNICLDCLGNLHVQMSADVIITNFFNMEFTYLFSDSAKEKTSNQQLKRPVTHLFTISHLSKWRLVRSARALFVISKCDVIVNGASSVRLLHDDSSVDLFTTSCRRSDSFCQLLHFKVWILLRKKAAFMLGENALWASNLTVHASDVTVLF